MIEALNQRNGREQLSIMDDSSLPPPDLVEFSINCVT